MARELLLNALLPSLELGVAGALGEELIVVVVDVGELVDPLLMVPLLLILVVAGLCQLELATTTTSEPEHLQ